MEVFGILELALPIGDDVPEHPKAVLVVENQKLSGHAPGDGTMRFRFCPKAAKSIRIQESTATCLHSMGQPEESRASTPSPGVAQHPAANLPNWWTDDPSPNVAEGSHHGAKTVNRMA